MEEKLIGGFMSGNMWREGRPYYGFYLTTDRIIGVRGFFGGNLAQGEWNSDLEASLFSIRDEFVGSPLTTGTAFLVGLVIGHQLSKDDAIKAMELLEGEKDLEVSREDVEELRIKKHKRGLRKFFGGHWGKLTIRTPRDTYTITIGQEVTEREVQRLKDMLTAFDKDKFVIEEK